MGQLEKWAWQPGFSSKHGQDFSLCDHIQTGWSVKLMTVMWQA